MSTVHIQVKAPWDMVQVTKIGYKEILGGYSKMVDWLSLQFYLFWGVGRLNLEPLDYFSKFTIMLSIILLLWGSGSFITKKNTFYHKWLENVPTYCWLATEVLAKVLKPGARTWPLTSEQDLPIPQYPYPYPHTHLFPRKPTRKGNCTLRSTL